MRALFESSPGVPNGILRTAAGELLVVNTLGKSLGVYQRDLEAKQPAAAPQAPPLVHVGDLALASGCDNLTENAEGDVLLACHPKSLTFLRHADDHAYPSPSEVLLILTLTFTLKCDIRMRYWFGWVGQFHSIV
jgi:hypothetical protein